MLGAWTATPAFAHDSSGGRVTEALLERVQFQDAPSSVEPVRFPWDVAAKAAFRARFREILRQMPFDVARLKLSDLRRIAVSNSWYTVPAKAYPRIARRSKPGDDYPPEAIMGSQRIHRDLQLTGDDYLDVFVDGDVAGGEFPFTVLHEFIHVWEVGRRTSKYRPEKTRPFYAIRFDRLKADWEQAQELANRDWKELSDRLDNEHEADALLPAERRRWKTYADFDNERTARITPPIELAVRRIEEARERLGIPTRFGGDTDRKLTGPWFSKSPDVHAMDAPTEYLACLVELLWKDPAWAAAQYTPEEIAWVRRNVFADRAVAPWRPPEEQALIDLAAKSAALRESMNEISRSLQ